MFLHGIMCLIWSILEIYLNHWVKIKCSMCGGPFTLELNSGVEDSNLHLWEFGTGFDKLSSKLECKVVVIKV